MNGAAAITRELIPRMDYLRGPVATPGRGTRLTYKEWFHFLVMSEDVNLLLNFTLFEDPLTNTVTPQLTALVNRQGRWSGDVYALEEVSLMPGKTEVRGNNGSFLFDGRNYQVDVRIPGNRISLELRPLTNPQLAGTASLGDGSFTWLAVPHLRAHGAIEVSGKHARIHNAPAYHDHNWGHFSWGGAYAWLWGVALPDDESGYGLVFDRVVNTSMQAIAVQGTILFQGSNHLRTFIDPEVSCEWDTERSGPAYRVPPVMRMAIPGYGPTVPDVCRIRSNRRQEQVELEFSPADTAEIGIPSDIDAGSPMIMSEAFGNGTIRGIIDGIAFENPVQAVYEQIESAVGLQ